MAVEFQLSEHVAREFPEFRLRLVHVSGLRNDKPWDDVEEELRSLEERVAGGGFAPLDEAHPAIGSWHEAYRRFGTNPRRTRSSLDALSRRLTKSGALPRINPAVDAYNLVCVTHGIPAGAYDVARLDGRIDLRPAGPGDVFHPLGQPETAEEPSDGEIVYAAGSRVLTRHWNHRDCDETKVTEDSTDVVFLLERISLTAVSDADLDLAGETLVGLVGPHADEVAVHTLGAESPTVPLGSR